MVWLEVRGTRARAGFPVVETGPGAWSLGLAEAGFELGATINQGPDSLTISLQVGTAYTHAGPLNLEFTKLVLYAL